MQHWNRTHEIPGAQTAKVKAKTRRELHQDIEIFKREAFLRDGSDIDCNPACDSIPRHDGALLYAANITGWEDGYLGKHDHIASVHKYGSDYIFRDLQTAPGQTSYFVVTASGPDDQVARGYFLDHEKRRNSYVQELKL